MNEGEYIVDMQHPEKTDQLTVKGLALLMAIFAEEENDENQPVIAGSITSLEHIVGLIDDSDPGTELTVIFSSPNDSDTQWEQTLGRKKYAREFSSFHKTTFTLRKGQDGRLEVEHLDGVSTNPDFLEISNRLILQALLLNAKKHDREPTKMLSREPLYPENEAVILRKFNGSRYIESKAKFPRQTDPYNCGVYAIKDGRFLTRNPKLELSESITLVETEQGTFESQNFTIPAATLRSTQYPATYEFLKSGKVNLDTPVNRKGATLSAFLTKYSAHQQYIKKFGEKYLGKVITYLENNDPQDADAKAKKYNCDNLTPEDITRINAARIAYQAKSQKRTVI